MAPTLKGAPPSGSPKGLPEGIPETRHSPYFSADLFDQIIGGADLLHAAIERSADASAPYQPALTAVRSKSRGYVHRYLSVVAWRTLHLQSGGECKLAEVLDASGEFTNIREGFALPYELTIPLAIRLGIPHPYNRFGHEFAQMTVDFLCTKRDGTLQAFDFKLDEDAQRRRVQEKMHLARMALESAGVPHRVITASQVSETLVKNIELLYPLLFEDPPLECNQHDAAVDAMRRELEPGSLTILDAARRLAEDFSCAPAQLVRTVLHAIAHQNWAVDLMVPLHPCRPVAFKGGAQ